MTNSSSKPEPQREPFWVRCGDSTPRDRRNSVRILWAVGAWGACFVGANQLLKKELVPAGIVSWLLAALPVITGIIVIFAYARYLRGADALQRMIHMRAIAAAFAMSWLAITCYPVFERIGAPTADTSTFSALMAVTYSLGVLIGARRFW